MEFGFEKFRQIFEIVQTIANKQQDAFELEEYRSKLAGLVTEEQLQNNLYLLLSLKQIQDIIAEGNAA